MGTGGSVELLELQNSLYLYIVCVLSVLKIHFYIYTFLNYLKTLFKKMASDKVNKSWNVASESTLKENFPLHRACRDGDTELLINLLKREDLAKFHIYLEDNYYGWTPAHWAAYFGKLDCLRALIMRNTIAAKDLPDLKTSRFQQTPAHIASFAGHAHCLLWLLQAGADANLQDYLGETPLHKAARSGSAECISLLIEGAAKPSLKNGNGLQPAELARENGFNELASHLCSIIPSKELGCAAVASNPTSSTPISNNGYYGFHPTMTTNGQVQITTDAIEPDEESMDTDSVVVTTQANGFQEGKQLNGSPTSMTHQTDSGFHSLVNGHQNGHHLFSNGSAGRNVSRNGSSGNGSFTVNGFGNATDITLCRDISRNDLPVAGKKRSREDSYFAPQVKKVRVEENFSTKSIFEDRGGISKESTLANQNLVARDPPNISFETANPSSLLNNAPLTLCSPNGPHNGSNNKGSSGPCETPIPVVHSGTDYSCSLGFLGSHHRRHFLGHYV